MTKFINYKSPEKDILDICFQDIPDMDKWLTSLIESYIYSTVREYYCETNKDNSMKSEYTTKYGLNMDIIKVIILTAS